MRRRLRMHCNHIDQKTPDLNLRNMLVIAERVGFGKRVAVFMKARGEMCTTTLSISPESFTCARM
jgi:hypothetical protein